MRPIIKVENLSKQYRIGAHQAPYRTLRETLTDAVKSPFKRFSRNGHPEENTIWALKDINFEVYPGEVIGIIGRNGAGKSTLLKILSRITEPTSGQVDIYGRVGSLLEVGTGFHQELTGRENIYLNGAILGMHRAEIDRKLDEIVDFAEIEEFIDTTVKHYSSGMYMRLAFSVAAHLDTEILIIDEVLAVGDVSFQRKCLTKMHDLSSEMGRTVILVSHNQVAINNLCSKALYLQEGRLLDYGDTNLVMDNYLHEKGNILAPTIRSAANQLLSNEYVQINSIEVAHQNNSSQFFLDDWVNIHITCTLYAIARMYVTLIIRSAYDDVIFEFPTELQDFKSGKYCISFQIPPYLLNSGVYFTQINFCDHNARLIFYINHATFFEIKNPNKPRQFFLPTSGYIKPMLIYEILAK